MLLISSDLLAFIAVAKAKGFSKAGRKLGLTPSTMTRRIEAFEQRLGARLFTRSTRGITLTDAGRQLFQEGQALLEKASVVVDRIGQSQHTPSGLLRVSASIGFGRRYIASRLGAFRVLFPEIRIELRLEDRYVDLAEGRYDLAVRVGLLPDSNLRKLTLAPVRRILCASPDYIARMGRPARPADIAGHDCVAVDLGMGGDFTWKFRSGRTSLINSAITVSSPEAAVAVALGGGGITHLPDWMVCEHIAKGELVPLLEEYAAPVERGHGVHLVWPENPPARTKTFADFLQRDLLSRLKGPVGPKL